MGKLAIQLFSAGLVLGFGVAPAMAQLGRTDSGRANTAEDFKNQDSSDGFLGSGTNIWDLYHQSGALRAVENGYSSNGLRRRINSQAESLRERQRVILEQQAAEVNSEANSGTIVDFAQ